MAQDFLTDDEMNQAAQPEDAEGMASKGWSQLLAPVAENLQGQYEQGGKQIHQAMGPLQSPETQQALVDLGQQAATGTLGGGEGGGNPKNFAYKGYAGAGGTPVFTTAPVAAEYGGLVARAFSLYPEAKSLPELLAAMGSLDTTNPLYQAVQQAMNKTKGFADGGEVHMAEGGEAPDFIPDEHMAAAVAPQHMGSASPADFIPDDQFKSDEDALQDRYGTPVEQAKAGLEGLAQGVAGPLAPAAERAAGVKPEDIRGREEANPWTHGLGEAAGFGGSMLAGTGEAALLEHAGEAVAKALPEANKIGSLALKSATEMGLLQTGDEVSKMIKEDPNQSVQTAVTSVGLAAALGGIGGGAIGAVSPLWNATVGSKAAQLTEDFKGRIHYRLNNPDLAESVTDELSNHYNNIKDVADDVYGPQGLKAQDIARNMPGLSDKMFEQSQNVATNVKDQIAKMVKKGYDYPPRLTQKLQADLDDYASKVSAENIAPADIFNATQDLKQTLQSYAKFDKFVKPTDDAYQFTKDAKKLAGSIREGLEDSKVWGAAADRQQAINKAFTQFKPALEDFEKKFTSEVNGERMIDPGKIQTYMNQLGKPNATVKQEMLKNFLDSSDKYAKVLSDTHENLGMESPFKPYSLTAVHSTLEKQTHGAKLADVFIDKGLVGAGGKALGAGVGAGIGKGLGSSALGAIIGERALGPFLESVLPAITKPLLSMASNAKGFKSAVDYGGAIVKGELLVDKATKNLFKGEGEVLPASSMPTDKDRGKIVNIMDKSTRDPNTLVNNTSKIGHYLPDHATALGETTGSVMTYLNSIKPVLDKANPLDSKPIASSTQIAAYNNALNIAQQPLVILDKISKGTVTPQDVQAIKAMYPSMYNKLVQKLTSQMVDHLSSGKTVPYKIRLGLTAFSGMPMDSTMTPQSILTTQTLSQPIGRNQAPGQNTQGNQSVKHSATSLNKIPSQYRTPGQAREAEKSAGK